MGLQDATNAGVNGMYPSAPSEPEAANHAAGSNGIVPNGSAPEPPAAPRAPEPPSAPPAPEPSAAAEEPAAHEPLAVRETIAWVPASRWASEAPASAPANGVAPMPANGVACAPEAPQTPDEIAGEPPELQSDPEPAAPEFDPAPATGRRRPGLLHRWRPAAEPEVEAAHEPVGEAEVEAAHEPKADPEPAPEGAPRTEIETTAVMLGPVAAPQKVAGPEPAEVPEPGTSDSEAPSSAPGFRERGRLRRRARYLRQVREIQLRDIGGLTLELHRFGRDRPDLVRAKVDDAVRTDAELRGLERALDGEASIRELREAGIGGACDTCRAVHGSIDRYCASCGEPINAGDDAEDEPDAADESTP